MLFTMERASLRQTSQTSPQLQERIGKSLASTSKTYSALIQSPLLRGLL
jgi:hypothetical protein